MTEASAIYWRIETPAFAVPGSVCEQHLEQAVPLWTRLVGYFIEIVGPRHSLVAIEQNGALAQLPLVFFGTVHRLQSKHHARAKVIGLPTDQSAGIEWIHHTSPSACEPGLAEQDTSDGRARQVGTKLSYSPSPLFWLCWHGTVSIPCFRHGVTTPN
jgi:hypothetical protein